jgi:hypothetical protein
MMPAMAEPPEELGARGADGTDLDPEDASVELDEDGFLAQRDHRRQFPTDLDVWLRWAAVVVVGVAAFETLAYLISWTVEAWATGEYVPLPPPDFLYSFVLLGGVLLLVLRRGPGSGTAGPGWLRGAACLAAGTGGALVVAQVAGNIRAIVQPPGEPGAYVAGNVIGGIGGLAAAIISAFAAVLAVLLYRWSRAGSEGECKVGPGAAPVPIRRAVAALVIGMAVGAAYLVATEVGLRNQQVNQQVSTPPTSGSPVFSVPSSGISITLPEECSSPSGGGAIVCTLPLPTEPALPSPSS